MCQSRAVLIALLSAISCPAVAADFLTANGSGLELGGRPYRAIGVNVPHLSQGYNGTWHHWREMYGSREAMREAIIAAIEDAAASEVAFIRFFASPGYPKGHAELYGRDRAEYWRQMDELIELCGRHGLKLVPCLGILNWHLVCGEPMAAVMQPGTRTHTAATEYVREFVTRYRDNPTILLWELENEAFLKADVDQEGRKAPPAGIYPPDFAPIREAYAREDSLRFDALADLYRQFTALIKELDPNHLVTSGDSGVREESMSRRLTFPDFRYRPDTLREHLANLLDSQPEPLDVASLHTYVGPNSRERLGNLSPTDYQRARVAAFHAARIPVFVGELGQTDPHHQADPTAQWTRAAIDWMEADGVALIALWVWHFRWQDKDHNIPSSAAQPELVQRVKAFNRRHAGQ